MSAHRPQPPAIQLDDVEVRYPGTREPVLSHVDLTVSRSEFIVVVGASGGGKTTLLNLLVGEVEATAGQVRIFGRRPAEVRSELALMMARDALLPWRSTRKNVEYGLELRGVAKAERRRRSETYLKQVGLEHAAVHWPWQLSQGMRQRAALARTWALQSEVLLMDEPFSAVDAQTRERLQLAFLDLWARDRRTVVFITHDLNEAVLLADRVIVVGGGGVLGEFAVPLDRPRSTQQLIHNQAAVALLDQLRVTLTLEPPTH